ncbi:putative protein TPRXL, partial [Stegodyphus dumicola]|uniref:putative protein TPRXL n=1 Tax=Stegodyphus dumicola TaxID=202533 RepID=UPI0015ACDCF7
MSDSPGNPVYSPEVSPSAISSGTTLLTPSLVSFTSSLPTSTNIPRVSGSKSTSFTTSTSTIAPTSNLTSPHTSLSSAGFTTILTASAAGGELSPAVQIGTFQSPESPSSPSGQRDSPPQQAIYGIPAAGQSFSLAIAGGSKSQAVASTSDSSSSSQNSLSVVQGSSNLSVVSGNVVIPQTILQANNSAVLYHTSQGLVYATPTNLPEGVVLNLGQEQGGTQQQFITIPVSLSLTPAQQQQLIQGTQGTSQGQNSSFSSPSNRREKSRK